METGFGSVAPESCFNYSTLLPLWKDTSKISTVTTSSLEFLLLSISSPVLFNYNVTTHHLEVCHRCPTTSSKVPKSVKN